MEIEGQHRVAAPVRNVWDAINDPDVLVRCIKGCESLEQTSDGGFAIVITTKIGPIKAKFKGTLQILDSRPPEAYSMRFEAAGGMAGFGKGVSHVVLSAVDDNNTDLSYQVETELGGKLAQLGGRLVKGVAKGMAEDFFTSFTLHLAQPQAAA